MSQHHNDDPKKEANGLIHTGLGIGALGAASAIIGGAVCPACVVVAPALIAVGAYKRWSLRHRPHATVRATP